MREKFDSARWMIAFQDGFVSRMTSGRHKTERK
jgi:hypothetical protein